ncbi:RGD1560158 (predicted), isoform CRA_a [Rattus norvegicus]|uniref:RGD1560158 (Predicted), isoform CRA_a n=1 Tax=Rattus norvegicus TaxID=10116 RepID=A6I5J3_RAT|nr:RGD1560158 (predicted), isoform CRA_a [Rattus norvegicus]
MPDNAILCYICGWSHGSFHVYSLVDGLVPGTSGGVWLVDTVVLSMGLQTPSAPSVFSLTPPLGSPCSVQWF